MNRSRFGKLIGVLDVSNSCCKFLVQKPYDFFKVQGQNCFVIIITKYFKVYAIRNREILTMNEKTISRIKSSDEEEYDPIELWNAVQEVNIFY